MSANYWDLYPDINLTWDLRGRSFEQRKYLLIVGDVQLVGDHLVRVTYTRSELQRLIEHLRPVRQTFREQLYEHQRRLDPQP